MIATLTAALDNPYAVVLFVGCGFFAAVTLVAVLTAKPEPASPYVVEPLDDEWAVLYPKEGGR